MEEERQRHRDGQRLPRPVVDAVAVEGDVAHRHLAVAAVGGTSVGEQHGSSAGTGTCRLRSVVSTTWRWPAADRTPRTSRSAPPAGRRRPATAPAARQRMATEIASTSTMTDHRRVARRDRFGPRPQQRTTSGRAWRRSRRPARASGHAERAERARHRAAPRGPRRRRGGNGSVTTRREPSPASTVGGSAHDPQRFGRERVGGHVDVVAEPAGDERAALVDQLHDVAGRRARPPPAAPSSAPCGGAR